MRKTHTVRSRIFFASGSSFAPFWALIGPFGTVVDDFDTPIISSASLFCLCSGVSFQDELSSPSALGPFAPLLVLKVRGLCLVGSMRAARSSCLGGFVIQSSRLSFSVDGAGSGRTAPAVLLPSFCFGSA